MCSIMVGRHIIGLGDGVHLFGGGAAVSFPTVKILEVSAFSITEGQERNSPVS
jgi:hypothetical protein